MASAERSVVRRPGPKPPNQALSITAGENGSRRWRGVQGGARIRVGREANPRREEAGMERPEKDEGPGPQPPLYPKDFAPGPRPGGGERAGPRGRAAPCG